MVHHIHGGTGGGGTVNKSYNGIPSGSNGTANGGSGAIACVYLLGNYHSGSASGGTGNPGGDGASGSVGFSSYRGFYGNDSSYKGNDGTGGLLVISCNKYNNNGTIEANGVGSRAVGLISGGASGGGSINIFYNEFVANNSCVANGGTGVNYGGSGGAGTVTIGNISTGTFVQE